MGILGRAWKARIRRHIVATIRRHRGGVPAPTRTIAIRRLAARPAGAGGSSAEIVRWDDEPARLLPRRSVGGELAGFAAVAACLEGDKRRWHEQMLSGSVRQPAIRRFAARLDVGRVLHHSGIVLADGGTAVAGDVSAIGFSTPLPENPLLVSHLPRPRPVSGAVAVISTCASWNYFHWMTEALPRLTLCEGSGWPVDLYHAPVAKSFQRESLRLLGIPADRILPAGAATHLEAAPLIVTPVTSVLSAGKLDFLASRLTAGLPAGRPGGRRLFILRRRGPRRIVNESAVLTALAPLGFEPCRLESLPLAAQIAAFAGAECVVGPHGAGLTNLLFCPPGTRVVEIGTPFRPWTCFWEIAHHRGLAYHLHLSRPVRVRRFDLSNGVGDSDLAVDPRSLRADVERLLAASAEPATRAA